MRKATAGFALDMIGGLMAIAAARFARRLVGPLVKQRAPRPLDVFESERALTPLGLHHRPGEAPADAIARLAFHQAAKREPSEGTSTALAAVIRIVGGTGAAAIYGALFRAPRRGLVGTLRRGALFGIGVWLLIDELAAPVLGLRDKPTAYHPSQHAQRLAADVGYGIAIAATRGLLGRPS